jgi:hypothetical protein
MSAPAATASAATAAFFGSLQETFRLARDVRARAAAVQRI